MANFRPKYDDQPVYHNTSGMMKSRGPPLKPPIKFAPPPAAVPHSMSPRLPGPGIQEKQLNDQANMEGNSSSYCWNR